MPNGQKYEELFKNREGFGKDGENNGSQPSLNCRVYPFSEADLPIQRKTGPALGRGKVPVRVIL